MARAYNQVIFYFHCFLRQTLITKYWARAKETTTKISNPNFKCQIYAYYFCCQGNYGVIYCGYMTPVTQTRPHNTITLNLDEVRRLFRLSAELADVTEDILEQQGAYSEEFLSGLSRSLQEAREGNLRTVNSLADLS